MDVGGKSWDDIIVEALRKKKARGNVEDTHYIKGRDFVRAQSRNLTYSATVVRTLKETARLWQDEDTFYRKAAIKFVSEFEDWSGFGRAEEREGPKL